MSMLQRVWIPSPNHYGTRSSTRLLIIHTAEGALTYQSLGNYFSNPSAQVSSQVGIDDTPGVIGEYVAPDNGAWAAMAFNNTAAQAELCGFAAWTAADWQNHSNMLDNTARWIAEECARYSLPIVKLDATAAQGTGHGVCGHVDLGVTGGGHHDPGPDFPWDQVIAAAQHYASPVLPPAGKESNMLASTPSGNGYWEIRSDGSVWSFGDAEYHGGLNPGAPFGGGAMKDPGETAITITAHPGGQGYWILSSSHHIFAFGAAAYHGASNHA